MKDKKIDLGRLGDAIYMDRRILERFRLERKKAVEAYVGNHWSSGGSQKRVPVNLISLYCLDAQTEVLTPSGWVYGENLGVGDIVAGFDPKTGESRWEPVQGKIHRPLRRGEYMLAAKGPSVDIRVSNRHRMVFRTNKEPWRVKEAGELSEQAIFRLPTCGVQAAAGLPLSDADIMFVGLVMTDGCYNPKNEQIALYQTKSSSVFQDFEDVVTACGFKTGRSERSDDTNYGPRLSPLVRWTVSRGKPRGRDKHLSGWDRLADYIPKVSGSWEIWENATEKQWDVFLAAMHAGDGAKQFGQSWTRRSYHIAIKSRVNAEAIQSLSVRRGWRCSLTERPNGPGRTICTLHLKKTDSVTVRGTSDGGTRLVRVPHGSDEKVWCISVPSGAFISRRGGKVVVVGNTQIVGRNLIAKNPRVMLSVFNKDMKAPVNAMQTWANKEIEQIYLANTLQRVVLDALFSVGICKVALATPSDSALMAWNQSAGQPFACRVDLDDFVFDTHARDFAEVSYMGHRYRAPIDVVKDSKFYGNKRKDLQPTEDKQYNQQGDERIGALGRGEYAGDITEFEDMVDLWEIYLPRHRKVLTIADDAIQGGLGDADGLMDVALREQDWLGPPCGPYHMLGYRTVPGNAMPKAPIQDLIDLHDSANRLYRKLIDQAERQKELLTVQGGADADGNRIMHANDGEVIRLDRPEANRPWASGGANAGTLQMAMHLIDRFSWLAGNLDSMGGLSPQSKTAKQDAMLAENSAQSISDMQAITIDYTAGVLKALCWYWWNDPVTVQKSVYALPGMPDIAIQREVQPQQRQAVRFEDLDVQVDPYSMQHSTPQQRGQMLQGMVQQTIIPLAGLLQQNGVMFDVNAYLQQMARLWNMPELVEIISIQEPPEMERPPSGGAETGAAPAETTRNYVRESRSNETQGKKMNEMMTAMKPSQNGTPQGANA